MKKQTKTPAPPPPPQLLEGEIPTYTQLGLDDSYRDLVIAKAKVAAKIKKLELEETDLKEQILAITEAALSDIEQKSVQVGAFRVIYSSGAERKTINPKKLLKNGVSADVILKSTDITTSKPYVTVKEAGGNA